MEVGGRTTTDSQGGRKIDCEVRTKPWHGGGTATADVEQMQRRNQRWRTNCGGQDQVKFSLEAAKFCQSNAGVGLYDASAVSSRESRSLAEDACFHPSIMSISYYSFEHCFSIYSPFFLPVSMHVLLGLAALREWKRYKQENRKHLAGKAKAKVHLNPFD
ncbi:uncharacterized protein LOC133307096 [Gastrolobium bilobum]|uniref:uncharacterized protein LOC133307096 n=1 Tax=Gastrolobium bilobum TaxID=150636 RepID=UPI002AB2E4AB|nr:uncharacterized protein LOC133307096 [Gastrolobium bilobum]